MRNMLTKNAPASGDLVQDYIGTAYDTVKAVADALAAGTIDGLLASTDINTLAKLNIIVADATLGDAGDFASAAEGALAATASQPGHTHTSGDITDFGTYMVTSDINSLSKLNAIVLDATLGTASDFATSAQGALADTASQPGHTHTTSEITDFGTYMQTSDINSLSKLNALVLDATLGDSSDFATAAQGALADTATQAGDNVSDLVNDAGYVTVIGGTFIYTMDIETVANQDYVFWWDAPFAGTINTLRTKTQAGTCTVTGKVNAVILGGTANSASTSAQEQAHVSTNTFVKGDKILVTISANAAATDLAIALFATRTA